MKTFRRAAWIFLLAIVPGFLVTQLAMAQARYKSKASAVEIAQLPKYCYAQYVDGTQDDPKYATPATCGLAMNHLCPALVFLSRAQKANPNKAVRREDLRMAIQEIQYTLNHMAPACPIRDDVDVAMQRARIIERVVR